MVQLCHFRAFSDLVGACFFSVNDPEGGPPFWNPPYDLDINPFPPCEVQREYLILNYLYLKIYVT